MLSTFSTLAGRSDLSAESRDLRSFSLVATLIGVAMAVGAKMFLARDEDAEHHRLPPIAAALAGLNATSSVDPAWCSKERLGSCLIERLNLPINILPDDQLESVVLFGLEHVTLAVQTILKNTEAQADWHGVTVPLLNEIHTFAASVFAGTADALFPGLTLDDLVRQSLMR